MGLSMSPSFSGMGRSVLMKSESAEPGTICPLLIFTAAICTMSSWNTSSPVVSVSNTTSSPSPQAFMKSFT